MATWDDLPEHLRESNRAQVAGIFDKLEAIGCLVHEAPDGAVEIVELTPDEIERIAELEHERWTVERLADGWTPSERDVLEKRSPYLVSWKELSEEVRDWDREAARAIAELLAGVGLEIRRGE